MRIALVAENGVSVLGMNAPFPLLTEKAEPLYERTLAIYEQALGPDHPYGDMPWETARSCDKP